MIEVPAFSVVIKGYCTLENPTEALNLSEVSEPSVFSGPQPGY